MSTPNVPTTPATYSGSLVAHHGPVLVALDTDGTRRAGAPRFLAWTADGEFLRQVSLTSLDFSPPRQVGSIWADYCPTHDLYGCPYTAAHEAIAIDKADRLADALERHFAR